MADSRRPWLLLALAWIAAFTALFDSNVVSLALPSMAADLHRSVLDLAWVVTAFLLPLAAALIAAGRLGDRFGARNLIVPGAGLFLAATAVAGVAPSFEVLVFARVVQGLAAAVLWTLSLAIVVTAFPPEKRPLAVSIYFTSGTLGAVIGPVVGGALTGLGGWRLVFFAQLPLPVIVLAASVAIPAANPGATDPVRRTGDRARLVVPARGQLCVAAGPRGRLDRSRGPSRSARDGGGARALRVA